MILRPWDPETMRVRKGFHCLWLHYQNQQCAHHNLSGFFLKNNQRHHGCQLHWTRKLQKSCVFCSQMFPLCPNICRLGFDPACSVPNSFVSKHNFVDFCFYNQSVFSELAMFCFFFLFLLCFSDLKMQVIVLSQHLKTQEWAFSWNICRDGKLEIY